MKFDLSEDQALLRSSTRDFCERELPIDKTRIVMEQSKEGYEPGMWRGLADMGYLGLLLPESAGGQGLGAVELAVVLEELGRVCAPGPYLDAVLAASVLATAGGHEALLSEIAAGRTLVVLARDDSAYSGNHVEPTRFANGRVRGTKHFVPFGAAADKLLVETADGLVLADAPSATPARDDRSSAALRLRDIGSSGDVRRPALAPRACRSARGGRCGGDAARRDGPCARDDDRLRPDA